MMMLSRWNKADHPVAVAVFAVALVLMGITMLVVMALAAALGDLQFIPDCTGNC